LSIFFSSRYQVTTKVDHGVNDGTKYSEYSSADNVVWRRYNDFRWLYDTLCVRYPGTIVPPLPRAKTFGNLEPLFIKERQAELEFFLQSVVQHPILQISFFLKTFLVASRRGLDAAMNITEESRRVTNAVVGSERWGGGGEFSIPDFGRLFLKTLMIGFYICNGFSQVEVAKADVVGAGAAPLVERKEWQRRQKTWEKRQENVRREEVSF
jgi:hypothetical protein